ncbi:sigma-70 family RNA polymerase sigma factor [Wenzhouxiangella marina]|uniref:RNA polymerase sigma 70 n=1 Tax=Wenzhouxiangella marina TaxID=1579979 RepID=A0A0K0XXT8_9GAMM|nr:sigma-70 family RNA polymerase sigma factor [Wenzhouxiangella marina]AKS42490.1 RNA polymerase sigma 70 [Wenzhouxiangella marina]MBB6085735.1 RNA polymerase sigma factor (TIGR02999 family) [Wenzhouxiangella marina]
MTLGGPADSSEITQLLRHWSQGDERARDQLLARVYDRLHQLADQQFRRERGNHTLQPTALVHEAFISLDSVDIEWQGRDHFYALVAQVMRRLLVDHARSRARQKRGGGQIQIELEDCDASTPAPSTDLLALDEALTRLAERSERIARALELCYFGGLTQDAVARILDISRRTVDRDLKLGRAWLRAELEAS